MTSSNSNDRGLTLTFLQKLFHNNWECPSEPVIWYHRQVNNIFSLSIKINFMDFLLDKLPLETQCKLKSVTSPDRAQVR